MSHHSLKVVGTLIFFHEQCVNVEAPQQNTHLSMLTADQLDQRPLLEGELLCTLGLVGVQSSGHSSWGNASVTLALALALAGCQHSAVQA